MTTSIIIPTHNDFDTLRKTVTNVLETNGSSFEEMIIVDDNSDVPLENTFGDRRIHVIRNVGPRFGVGAAFDAGAIVAKGDVLFLMGSDVRFQSGIYTVRYMCMAADSYDNLVCGTTVGVTDEIDCIVNRDMVKRCGASLKWKMTVDDISEGHPMKKQPHFRDILSAQWISYQDTTKTFEQVGCVLGAAYAIRKSLYDRIGGFRGHRTWGGLEPMISIKVWLSGGLCIACRDVVIGHVYSRHESLKGNNKRSWRDNQWNKMYMAYTYFDDAIRHDLVKHVTTLTYHHEYNKYFRTHPEFVKQERAFFAKSFVRDVRDTILWDTYDFNTYE